MPGSRNSVGAPRRGGAPRRPFPSVWCPTPVRPLVARSCLSSSCFSFDKEESLMRKVRSIKRRKAEVEVGRVDRIRNRGLERGRGRGDWPTAERGRDPRRNDDRKTSGGSVGIRPRVLGEWQESVWMHGLGESSRRRGVAASAARRLNSPRPCPAPTIGFGSGPRAHIHSAMATSASHHTARSDSRSR